MRKQRLIECNPRWATQDERVCYLIFDCPEGHADCTHAIPFTPALDGTPTTGTAWKREGDQFDTLSLSPSIRRKQRYANREAALKAGCIPEHIEETMFCALHIFIKNGAIQYCGDSA
jgi:hypothetical protein